MKIKLFFLLSLFCFSTLHAQNKQVLDSTITVYKTTKYDTVKILALVNIAALYSKNKPDTCISLAKIAIEESEKKKFNKGQAKGLHVTGTAYAIKADYTLALEYYQKSLSIYENLGNQVNVSEVLNDMGIVQLRKSNYTIALEIFQKNLKIFESFKNKRGVANSLMNIGAIYNRWGNYPLSLDYYQKSLKVAEEINDKQSIANCLNNIGIIYENQDNNNVALEYYHKALQIKEKLGNKSDIASSLNNIGNIYSLQNKDSLALTYYLKVLKIREELGDKKGIVTALNHVANIYYGENKDSLALNYYQKALAIGQKEGIDKKTLIYTFKGLATVYKSQKDYKQSLKYLEEAMKLAQEIKLLPEINTLSSLFYELYKREKDYEKALTYHELFKKSNDSLFNVEKAKSIANLESKVALEKKDKELVLLAKDNELTKLSAEKQARELELAKRQAEAKQLFAMARAEKDRRKADSLYTAAQKAQLEADNLKTKNEKIQLEQEKNILAHEAELEHQKNIRNTFLGIASTFLIIIILVFIGYRQKRKSNLLLAQQNEEIKRQQFIITEANQELSQANEELSQQQEELVVLNENLEEQKREVEVTYTKLKTTSDSLNKSINYASQVQEIILADIQKLQNFFADVFIIFRPRDVVSGDFYWFSQISATQSIFVLADCTGHGVPGAFMSMLGSTLLNEVIDERAMYHSPAEILKFIHKRLRKILKQDTARNSDGMDISICYFDKQDTKTKLVFAGAKTAMWYVENNQFNIINGNRIYLGGINAIADFEDRMVEVEKHTTFYFFTDGFADQNDSERNRFGIKKLQNLLLSGVNLPFETQKDKLIAALETHQGTEPQRDDISLVGLKI
jgi:serine phosphatase RsbU (regulator of sigma subunit)